MFLSWIAELIVRDSLRNLVRHKLRSALTLLGVIFGVASVITMMAIGEGAQRTVLRELEGLGLRNIIVESVQPPDVSPAGGQPATASQRMLRYGLTRRDVQQVAGTVPGVSITATHPVKSKVFYGGRRLDVETLGVLPDYLSYFESRLVAGRWLTPVDEVSAAPVAVLSEPAAGQAMAVGGVLGRNIRIGGQYFQVVGIVSLASRKGAGTVLVPRRTAENLFGTTSIRAEAGRQEFTRTEVGQVVIRTETETDVPGVAALVAATLERSHARPDFAMTVPLDILKSKQRTQHVFNMVLIAIASISLLVGGIGIMNIMLAIVVERVPEIGIRRAIGARKLDVFLQFLSETLTLSGIGGLAGCALGICMVPLASLWTGWPGEVTSMSVIMSLSVSLVVGLVFGTAPALRAARMNPVEALRHE